SPRAYRIAPSPPTRPDETRPHERRLPPGHPRPPRRRCASADDARALFASPGLAGLTELGLEGVTLREEGLAALAAAPHLGRLRRLEAGGTSCGAKGVRAL